MRARTAAAAARKEAGFLLLWLIFFPAFLRLLFYAINYGTAAAELSPAQFAMRKKKSHVCHTKLLKYFLKEHIYEHFGLQLDRSTFYNSLLCIPAVLYIRVTILTVSALTKIFATSESL